jgi:alkylhydroperoxidase/carboxymuconolactone decarboxylase family protein YurZ
MKNEILNQIYGDFSSDLLEKLESLSPKLNDLIQNVAYAQFWTKEGIDLKTKCIITVSSLVALNKSEQLKIHMKGFLNQGGTFTELEDIFIHLIVYCGFPSVMNAFVVLKELKEGK